MNPDTTVTVDVRADLSELITLEMLLGRIERRMVRVREESERLGVPVQAFLERVDDRD